ncbi:hypothetical protein SEA_MASELOP_17 [Rhodococcus phage Maselop]|nr:hypothetical protein SEA_MASELOP_17 [Rhodococcus phage Maselop]
MTETQNDTATTTPTEFATEFAHFTVPSGPQGADADSRHCAVVSLPVSGPEGRQFLRDYMRAQIAAGFRETGLEGTLKQFAVISVVAVPGNDEPHGGVYIDREEGQEEYLKHLHDMAGYLQDGLKAEAAQKLADMLLGGDGAKAIGDLAQAIMSGETESVEEVMGTFAKIVEESGIDPAKL